MKNPKSTRPIPENLLNELQSLVAEAETLISKSASEHSADAFKALRARFDVARERFTEAYDYAKDKVAAGVETTDATIRAHPYRSLAIALGVGVITGALASRRCK